MGKIKLVAYLGLLFCYGHSHAQIVEKVIPPAKNTNARTQQQLDTLSLPFWDDFSQNTGFPNSSKWVGSDALVSYTLGIKPPSIGVLVFDGLNGTGSPHNSNTEFVGPSDSIVSMPINLGTIPDARKNTVWFSFFWQARGLGEIPDVIDSLRLQFYTATGQWRTVWSKTGGLDNVQDDFAQVLLQLDRQEYFHRGFRFKFQAFTRLTGPFDSFLIDYVYLNEGRSSQDNVYFDRALTSIPTYVLDGYSAVPMKQFATSPQSFVKPPEVSFYNLDNQLQPVDYSVLVKNKITGATVETLNAGTVVNPVPLGLERRTITANAPNVTTWPLNQDSLYLQTHFFIGTGDQVRNGVDYRVNDTVKTGFILHDYFAYDDGTAEYAAGINQNRGQLVVKYYAPKADFLTHIDIHFPQIAPLSNGQPIEIIVLRNLDQQIGSLVAKQPGMVQYSTNPNGMVSYALEIPVQVQDTFYVGFTQFTDNFIGVGLDKNNDKGLKVYANVLGFWEQNTRVQGSLMIRPRFGKIETVTSIRPVLQSKLYPNPTSGFFQVDGPEADELTIINLAGSIVYQKWNIPENHQINISHQPSGLYILKIRRGFNSETHKVFLKK